MSFTQAEFMLLLDLCKKKLKGIDWVLKEKAEEFKEDKQLALEQKRDLLVSLIDRIEQKL